MSSMPALTAVGSLISTTVTAGCALQAEDASRSDLAEFR